MAAHPPSGRICLWIGAGWIPPKPLAGLLDTPRENYIASAGKDQILAEETVGQLHLYSTVLLSTVRSTRLTAGPGAGV